MFATVKFNLKIDFNSPRSALIAYLDIVAMYMHAVSYLNKKRHIFLINEKKLLFDLHTTHFLGILLGIHGKITRNQISLPEFLPRSLLKVLKRNL